MVFKEGAGHLRMPEGLGLEARGGGPQRAKILIGSLPLRDAARAMSQERGPVGDVRPSKSS